MTVGGLRCVRLAWQSCAVKLVYMKIERREVTDWSLSSVLLLALLEAMLVPPLGEMGLLNRTVADAVFISVLALGAWLFFDRTSVGKIFVAIATVSVVLRIGSVFWPQYQYPVADAWVSGLALLFMAWLVIAYTLAPGELNVHRIAGGVGAYLLLGIAFAQFHRLIALKFEGAYLLLGNPATFEQMDWRLNYFSFVVLTTLGFGDITPSHALAKSLSTFEALIGVLYPVVFLGWVVSNTRPDMDHRD
jgi:Ion channel